MKKLLTILTVALLASTTVFAAVNFSGSSTIGYQFNYGNTPDKWTQLFYGDDGDDTNPSSLNLSISDENGVWSVGFRAGLYANRSDKQGATLGDTGSMGGDVTINFAKLFGLEDWTLKGGMIGNSRYTALRAYSNQSGKSFDRIRTADNSYVAWAGVGYGGFVEAQLAMDPGLNPNSNDDNITTTSDIIASALVTPINGIKVSADYAWKGDTSANKGLFSAAADINLGKLLDLDFNIGISVADKYAFEAETNTFATTVYGGVEAVEVAVEYAYTADKAHYLYAGATFNVIENLLLDAYFGANDVTDFANEFFVGGNVGYVISGITFNLGLEYSAGAAYNYDLKGLNIVPSVSFAW